VIGGAHNALQIFAAACAAFHLDLPASSHYELFNFSAVRASEFVNWQFHISFRGGGNPAHPNKNPTVPRSYPGRCGAGFSENPGKIECKDLPANGRYPPANRFESGRPDQEIDFLYPLCNNLP
jgi:hypothetical protein